MVKVICHKEHRHRRRMVQCYSTGDGNLSCHSSPQPKRQMDRFSHFSTAYGTKVPILCTGRTYPSELPFPWGIWTCHVTHDALAHASPQAKRHLDRFSRVYTDDRRVSLYWFACFPLKIVPFHVGIWTSCYTWFIGLTRVRNANGNLIVSAVFAGLTIVTD